MREDSRRSDSRSFPHSANYRGYALARCIRVTVGTADERALFARIVETVVDATGERR